MKNTIRQIYLYAATLIFMMMAVVATIQLLNIALKTYVFTKADRAYEPVCGEMYYGGYYGAKPVMPSETSPVVTAPTEEQRAEQARICEEQKKNAREERDAQRQRELVNYLSMLVVSAPLFYLHFRWVQKERREELSPKDLPKTSN
jgi:hypothetical protein